ncbi:permease [Haladaptatus halobius]|uniref:permease n=1 Tax=Haladaptatus halobius TaxID=2884875 RepID=UPI001D0BCF6F|nr:permease [Haladaptatus halobius]
MVNIVTVIGTLVDGVELAVDMAWETWWALVFGFTLTGAVKVFVNEEWLTQVLGENGWREVAIGTLFGASSSSCSYTAIATTKAIFKKGASPVASLAAFQFASTNLVIELGLVLWILLGWQFVAADFVGGLIVISLLAATYMYAVPNEWFTTAQKRLQSREEVRDPVCGMAVEPTSGEVIKLETEGGTEYFCSNSCKVSYENRDDDLSWRDRFLNVDGWKNVFRNAIGEWDMLWEEIALGFLIAGLLGAFVPRSWWTALFSVGTQGSLTWVIAGSIIGLVVGITTFVCSVGNVPFALVLWTNGIPFGSVISFIFADLLIPPLVNGYRKYYGVRIAAVLFASMFLASVVAGVLIHYFFGAFGLIPPQGEAGGTAPETYTTVLNVVFTVVFALEVYVTFGLDRLSEMVIAVPRKLKSEIRRVKRILQGGRETVREMVHELREAVKLTREAFSALKEALRLAIQAFRLMKEAFELMREAFRRTRRAGRKMKEAVLTTRRAIQRLKAAIARAGGAFLVPFRKVRNALQRSN